MVSIFIDSLSGIVEERCKNFYGTGEEIRVFPYLFNIEGKEVLTSEVSAREIMIMKGKGVDVKTSRPALNVWKEMIIEEYEKGKDVLYIASTSKMTGALQAVKVIGNLLKNDYPDRTLEIIDTGFTTIYVEAILYSLIGVPNKMENLIEAVKKSISSAHAKIALTSTKTIVDNNRFEQISFKFPVIDMKDGVVIIDREFDTQKEAVEYIKSLMSLSKAHPNFLLSTFSPDFNKEDVSEVLKDLPYDIELQANEMNSCMLTYLGEHSIGYAWF